MSNEVEKERKIQKALGTIQTYKVPVSVPIQELGYSQVFVDALSKQDAIDIVHEMNNTGDWERAHSKEAPTFEFPTDYPDVDMNELEIDEDEIKVTN